MSTENLSLGQRIRAARQDRGLSLAGLARKVQVNQTTILGWERDRHRPEAPSLRRTATALHQDPDEWLRLAGYIDERGEWQDPREPSPPSAGPADPLMLVMAALESGPWPQNVSAAVYALLAAAADDKRGLWQRRVEGAISQILEHGVYVVADHAESPGERARILFELLRGELFGGLPPPESGG